MDSKKNKKDWTINMFGMTLGQFDILDIHQQRIHMDVF